MARGGPDDIILDCLRRIRPLVPTVSPREWLHLELELREAWGGTRPCVARDPDCQKRPRRARRQRGEVPR